MKEFPNVNRHHCGLGIKDRGYLPTLGRAIDQLRYLIVEFTELGYLKQFSSQFCEN